MKSYIFIAIPIFILLENSFISTEDELVPPALTCVVLGDPACHRMCLMLGRIYAAPSNPAKCDSENNCECSMIQHKYLDDLWRDKFKSDDFLETIEISEQRYQDIVEVMKMPYQTREQTKGNLEWFFAPDDFAKIQVNDNVAENMIKRMEGDNPILDRNAIGSFVSQNLQSDPLVFPSDFDYKLRFRQSLENAPDQEIVQYIIHDVRRSKNPVLNEIADEFLKERNIKEEPYIDDEDDESFTDILDLDIVVEYLNPGSLKTDQRSDDDSGRWDLPNLDVSSVQAFDKGYECWTNDNKEYEVCLLKADWGDIHLRWTKGGDIVEVNVDVESGDINQTWHFEKDVEISLSRNSDGELNQTWKFPPDSQFDYIKTGEVVSETWLDNKSNDEALTKYKSFIDSWCDKNSIFVEKNYCVIY